jgi:GDP-L-fucose synthase
MVSLAGKRVIVTGGAGFLGSFLVQKFREKKADVFVPRSHDCDLTEAVNVRHLYRDERPQIVVHLAARVGGIGANAQNPGRFFYANMMMGLNVVEEARLYGGIEKLVIMGTTCSYPKFTPVPFSENDLWNGYPEETNASYGIAKRALLAMSSGYRTQYDMNIIYLLSANLYGPGDNFDLETSHVIPALIRKFVEAKNQNRPTVTAWGTGTPSREFLYVEDAAEGITLATEQYEKGDPINLGTGHEIQVMQLVSVIQKIVQYEGEVVWDTSRPDGQPRRQLDIIRAQTEFGFKARTTLEQGIQRTVEWYLANRDADVGINTG